MTVEVPYNSSVLCFKADINILCKKKKWILAGQMPLLAPPALSEDVSEVDTPLNEIVISAAP